MPEQPKTGEDRRSRPGRRTPGSGRPKGKANKTTEKARECFRLALNGLAPKLRKALDTTLEQDPARGVALVLELSTRFIPVLSRQEITGEGGTPLVIKLVRYSEADDAKQD